MSEGKKTLVVTNHLDRILIREQLKHLGVNLELIVHSDATSSLVNDLLSQHEVRDEVLGAMQMKGYTGDYTADYHLLVETIAKEFSNFCGLHKFKALRDSIIGKLNYEFQQGPDSGGNPAIVESLQESSATIKTPDNIIPTILMEVLQELKGIKEVVTSPTALKIDMGAEARTAMDPRLKEFLSKSGPVGIAGFVDGLKSYLNAVAAEEKPIAELDAWLDFVYKHPEVLKRQMQTYECRPVHTKEELIKELTAALTGRGVPQLFPMVLALDLNAKETAEMFRLLKPKVNFMGVDPGTFTPDSFFKVLLSALQEEVPSDVHFCGMSAIRAQDRELVIEKLERVIGKQSVKVAGHTKETFVNGLSRALTQALPPNTDIVIQGIDNLDKEDTRVLFNLLNANQEGTSTSIWHQTNTRVVLEKLIESIGGNEVAVITLHDLKCIDPRVKCNLHTALKAALEKYDELEARDKKLYVAGEEHLPKEVTKGNVAYTLGIFTNLWAQAALQKGIELDQLALLNHLLKQVTEGLLGEAGSSIFTLDIPGPIHVKNATGVSIKFGNQSFTRNEDGSLKIVTRPDGGDNVNTFVLATDGSLKFDNPGYMG